MVLIAPKEAVILKKSTQSLILGTLTITHWSLILLLGARFSSMQWVHNPRGLCMIRIIYTVPISACFCTWFGDRKSLGWWPYEGSPKEKWVLLDLSADFDVEISILLTKVFCPCRSSKRMWRLSYSDLLSPPVALILLLCCVSLLMLMLLWCLRLYSVVFFSFDLSIDCI